MSAVHTTPKTWVPERRIVKASCRFDDASPDGPWRRFDALFSKGGNVQSYILGGRTVREYRPLGEVEDSVGSGPGAPITLRHPPNNLRSDTALGHARGSVLDVSMHTDGVHSAGSFVAWDEDLLKFIDARIDSGDMPQFSVGYTIKVDPTPGISPDGERYDQIQRKIRWNHGAVLERGNAETAEILTERADAEKAGQICDDLRPMLEARKIERKVWVDLGAWTRHDGGLLIPADLAPTTPTRTDQRITMTKIKIDGAEHEVPGPVAAHIERLDAKATEDAKTIATLEGEIKTRTDAAETMISRADADAEVAAAGTAYGEAIELCQLAHGAEWRKGLRKVARKDSDGAEIAPTLADLQSHAIKGAFGERADTITQRIDSASDSDSVRAVYVLEARDLLERRDSKATEVKKTIAKKNAEAEKRSDAQDPLVKAALAAKARESNYIGGPRQEKAQ